MFGVKLKLVTYTTMSANLALREIGIALFLACVGLEAGGGFIETIINGGYKWDWLWFHNHSFAHSYNGNNWKESM